MNNNLFHVFILFLLKKSEEYFSSTNIYNFCFDSIGVCEAIIASDGLEHIIALLNSSNMLVHGNTAVTIDCLVRSSPEGQRRLFKQYVNLIEIHYFFVSR